MTQKKGSAGGVACAIIQRKKAIDNYYKNPIICKYCNSILHIGNKKVNQIKLKKFCNSSCFASYNNANRKRKKKERILVLKTKLPKHFRLSKRTKKDIFASFDTWQGARNHIAKHARFIYSEFIGIKSCYNCGYDKHAEVCHIKPISEFPEEALIGTINSKENLIGLCPNCHWEFDNGLLKINSPHSY
jgi:hypothetical protein